MSASEDLEIPTFPGFDAAKQPKQDENASGQTSVSLGPTQKKGFFIDFLGRLKQQPEPKAEVKIEPQPEVKVEPKAEVKAKPQVEVKVEPQAELKEEPWPVPHFNAETEQPDFSAKPADKPGFFSKLKKIFPAKKAPEDASIKIKMEDIAVEAPTMPFESGKPGKVIEPAKELAAAQTTTSKSKVLRGKTVPKPKEQLSPGAKKEELKTKIKTFDNDIGKVNQELEKLNQELAKTKV
jgi:hypothetical protein